VRTYTKRFSPSEPNSPALEAAGLRWLAEATDQGGVQVVQPVKILESTLTLDYLPTVSPAPGAAETFGRALAHTHAAGASHFGAPPPPWSGPGAIGLAPLSFVASPSPGDPWGAFYHRERLAPYVAAATRVAALPDDGPSVFAALGQRLVGGLFDSPQPALVGSVARIHGDLWAGNVMWSPAPMPGDKATWTGACLIDPAAHGGHAETDLAMLALFGAPGLPSILAAYNEVSALADGYQDRVGLHQLHPLLVHACLFGASYGDRAVARARQYL